MRSNRNARGRPLSYCKACEMEDFAHSDLVPVLREIYAGTDRRFPHDYPRGNEDRKHWETAMTVRALRDHGVLRPDAELLGVGAGREDAMFHLTGLVRRVFATDLYLSPGEWSYFASPLMLVAPERLARLPFQRERLVVQHMDGRWLRYPDATFDAVFSASSIEHFGPLAEIAAAAYEMGRVLKPGGVLSLSTELRVDGPAGGSGWPGVVLLEDASIRRFIVEASGLELVDDLDLTMSKATLSTRCAIADLVATAGTDEEPYPQILLTNEGYVFDSVHLTLRKSSRYPASDNSWACPGEALKRRVHAGEVEAVERFTRAAASAPEKRG
ncbi:MAG: class I SAM-dependent methyltransferase [Acidobacteriia bacterium]|nr:class I SAM-dependent methyltransferase [Terriglobia bacterium]